MSLVVMPNGKVFNMPGVTFPDDSVCREPYKPRIVLGSEGPAFRAPPPIVPSRGAHDSFLILDADALKTIVDELKDVIQPANDFRTSFREFAKHYGLQARAAIEIVDGRAYVVINGPRNDTFRVISKHATLMDRFRSADMLLGAVGNVKEAVKGTFVSIGIVVAADVMKAVIETTMTNKKFLWDEFAYTVSADVVKAVAVGAMSTMVGLFIAAGITTAVGAAVPIVVAAGVVIVVGFVIGKVVDAVLPTEVLAGVFRAAVEATQAKLAEAANAVYTAPGRLELHIRRAVGIPGY